MRYTDTAGKTREATVFLPEYSLTFQDYYGYVELSEDKARQLWELWRAWGIPDSGLPKLDLILGLLAHLPDPTVFFGAPEEEDYFRQCYLRNALLRAQAEE